MAALDPPKLSWTLCEKYMGWMMNETFEEQQNFTELFTWQVTCSTMIDYCIYFRSTRRVKLFCWLFPLCLLRKTCWILRDFQRRTRRHSRTLWKKGGIRINTALWALFLNTFLLSWTCFRFCLTEVLVSILSFSRNLSVVILWVGSCSNWSHLIVDYYSPNVSWMVVDINRSLKV